MNEKWKESNDEAREPRTTTTPWPLPVAQTPHVAYELKEKGNPEQREKQQEWPHEDCVVMARREGPFRDHHERQQDEVDREGRAVQGPVDEPLYVEGVSCHATNIPTAVTVMSSWQLWFTPTTTWKVEGTVWPAQFSVCRVGPLVVRCHDPGPSNGTSTTPSAAVSSPAITPFGTCALGTGSTDFTVELVTPEDVGTIGTNAILAGNVVVEVAEVVDVVDDVLGVLVGRDVVVAAICLDVAGIDVGVVEITTLSLVIDGLVDDVRVKTRTTSRIGLDHISTWVLRSDECIGAS
jgi:hypothetical protein